MLKLGKKIPFTGDALLPISNECCIPIKIEVFAVGAGRKTKEIGR